MSSQQALLCVYGLPLGALPKNLPSGFDVLCGFPATLRLCPDSCMTRFCLYTPLTAACRLLERLLSVGSRILVVAGGDPLYYGLGASLARYIPQEFLTIYPAPSSLQLACARCALPWHDVVSVSLHGRSGVQTLNCALQTQRPVCVLTDSLSSPKRLAAYLLEKGYACTMHVFANLGFPTEKHYRLVLDSNTSLANCAAVFADLPATAPCTILLLPDPTNPSPYFGIPDAFFSDAPYCTHRPHRAIALSLLELKNDDILWDVGAGSGALSLDAVPLLSNGAIYAIEEKVERYRALCDRVRACGGYCVTPVHGHAPDCLSALPDPSAILLGGGLARDTDNILLRYLTRRLRPSGRLLVLCVLRSSVETCTKMFSDLAWTFTTTLVQTAESRALANDSYFAANNPITLVVAEKTQ